MSSIIGVGPCCQGDCECERGKRGKRGHHGRRGHDGPTGPTGPSGTAVFGSFYSLSLPEIPAIASGDPLPFPNDGPANGIARFSATDFSLPVGTFAVSWHVSVIETGQLALGFEPSGGGGSVIQLSTVAGADTPDIDISNRVIVTNTTAGTRLTLRNVGTNPITITPNAGSAANPSSAWITIEKLL